MIVFMINIIMIVKIVMRFVIMMLMIMMVMIVKMVPVPGNLWKSWWGKPGGGAEGGQK